MKKLVIITDTHFGARNDSQVFSDYFFDFYQNQFFPYIIENSEDIYGVMHLGDCLDRRKFINYKTAMDFREKFIGGLMGTWLPCHFIVGNHDIYYKNTLDVNCYNELPMPGSESCWYVYDKPQMISIEKQDIAIIPWITAENYAETTKVLKSGAQIGMGHLEVKGFEMHQGVVSDHGFEKELFKNFEMVLSGHYHKRSNDGQIYYLGCPYEMTWADCGDPKGFHTFDLETRELEFIPNEYTMFEKIYYDDSKTDYGKLDISKYDKKYVKIFVENRKDYFLYDKFLDRLYKEITLHDLKIVEDFSDLSADFVHDDIVEGAQDTLSLLDRYVDEIETSLDKEKIKNKLKSFYIEAGDIEN